MLSPEMYSCTLSQPLQTRHSITDLTQDLAGIPHTFILCTFSDVSVADHLPRLPLYTVLNTVTIQSKGIADLSIWPICTTVKQCCTIDCDLSKPYVKQNNFYMNYWMSVISILNDFPHQKKPIKLLRQW